MLKQFILLTKFFQRKIILKTELEPGQNIKKPNAAPTRIRETNQKWSTPVVVVKKSLEMVRGELEDYFRRMKRERRRSEVFFLL